MDITETLCRLTLPPLFCAELDDPFAFLQNRTGSTPKKIAVIINFDGEERHLENVERSASTLKSEDYEVIVISITSSQYADHFIPISDENLKKALDGLKEYVHSTDEVVFYNTGHGDTGEKNRFLNEGLDAIPYAQRTIVMDQCFSGWARTFFADDPKTYLAFSASGSERSACGDFAPYFWSQNIPDQNQDGDTSFQERYAYASTHVTSSHPMSVISSGYVQAGTANFPDYVLEVNTSEELKGQLSHLKPGQFALVTFSASWCGPCKIYKPQFEAMAAQAKGQILFLRTENEALAEDFGAVGFPTVMAFDGQGSRFIISDRTKALEEIANTEFLDPLKIAKENFLSGNQSNFNGSLSFFTQIISDHKERGAPIPEKTAKIIDESISEFLNTDSKEWFYNVKKMFFKLISDFCHVWSKKKISDYIIQFLDTPTRGEYPIGNQLCHRTLQTESLEENLAIWNKLESQLISTSVENKSTALSILSLYVSPAYLKSSNSEEKTKASMTAKEILSRHFYDLKKMTSDRSESLRAEAVRALLLSTDNFDLFTDSEIIFYFYTALNDESFIEFENVLKKMISRLPPENRNDIFDYARLLDKESKVGEGTSRFEYCLKSSDKNIVAEQERNVRKDFFDYCTNFRNNQNSVETDTGFDTFSAYDRVLREMTKEQLEVLAEEFLWQDTSNLSDDQQVNLAVVVLMINLRLYKKCSHIDSVRKEKLSQIISWYEDLHPTVKLELENISDIFNPLKIFFKPGWGEEDSGNEDFHTESKYLFAKMGISL